jgi:hypothetical protein
MKRNCTSLFTIIMAITFCLKAQGQNAYTFTKIPPGTIGYQELFLDSDVTAVTDSIGYFALDTFLTGETFQVYNIQHSIGVNASIYLGDNGFLEIDNLTDSVAAIFDAGFTLLTAIDSSSKMSFLIAGSSGNLIVKMQFKNWKLTNGPAGNYANYQIWLYQQTGVIEFHYGSRSANNVSGYTVTNGPNVGAFLTPFDFSGCIGKLWCNGNPNNPALDSSVNYQFLAMQGLPDSGTVYRFSPQFAAGINEQDIEQSVFNLFPTLVTNTVFVQMNDNIHSGTEALVFDIAGKKIQSLQLKNGSNEIDVSDLKQGIYFISVNLFGNIHVKKFIKIE